MSWRKKGGINFSQYSNNIHSNLSNFSVIETLKINSNNTNLHIASNVTRIGNNTGQTEQINSIWFGGLDLDDSTSLPLEILPRSSIEERYYRSEYIGDTKQELFIYKGDQHGDRLRLKSSHIVFETYNGVMENSIQEDRFKDDNIRMIVTDTGNVGINTLEPRTTLDVNGQLLANYGNGTNGNGLVFNKTSEKMELIKNAYYYCGRLGVAFDFDELKSDNNNYKLKIEVFGGEYKGSTGMGIDTYIISNNTVPSLNNSSDDNTINSVIYKSSTCGGAGLGQNNDLYDLCIYRCKETGTDDVYIYIKGYEGSTLNIRAFLISVDNSFENMMQEQYITLDYQSSSGLINPGTDEHVNREAVFGPEAEDKKTVQYIIKYGFIERFDSRFGIGTNTFNNNVDYGVISGPVDIEMSGSSHVDGNIRIEENAYIDKDLTINGRLYLHGEMNVNSVVMENYQILGYAYVGAGLTLNNNQLESVPNNNPIPVYNRNFVKFENISSENPTTTYQIIQVDKVIDEANQYDFMSIGRATESSTLNNKPLDIYDYADICIRGDTGYIGMGTTIPKNKLDVVGNLYVGAGTIDRITSPENGAIIEGSVGIGTSVFPPVNNITCRISGSLAVGENISKIVEYYPNRNGTIIEGMVGIGIMNPQSILDIGGTLTFGDGSRQSFASTFLGARTNGIWSQMGTKDPKTFPLTPSSINGSSYTIENKTLARYVVDSNNNTNIIVIGCNTSTVDSIDNVGSVTSYLWSGMMWNVLGASLSGNINNKDKDDNIVGENFGQSVSIDGSGHTLLIGAPNASHNGKNNCGRLYLFEWENSRWISRQIGVDENGLVIDFYGEDENSHIGTECSISKNGKHILCGGKNINYVYYIHNANGKYITQKIYNKKEGSSDYEDSDKEFGCSLDITREGTKMLIGSCNANVTISENGVDKIYNSGCAYYYHKREENNHLVFDDEYYIRVRSPIPQNNQKFGSNITLNSMGVVFAISGPNYFNDTVNNIGFVSVYRISDTLLVDNTIIQNNNNTNAITTFGTLFGTRENGRFGSSVKLNGSGEFLSISSIGTTTTHGSIETFHYDTVAQWSRFSSTFIEDDYTLPGSTMSVSSDSTILVYGYSEKFVDTSYNCAGVIRLGLYENSITNEYIHVKNFIGINNDTPTKPLDIISTDYKDIIHIVANNHPTSINREGSTITDLNSYEGGLLIKNDFGGNTTMYLNNNDTIITNTSGSVKFNYKDSFDICKIGNTDCTFHAKNNNVGINNNNPLSTLDIKGKQILNDGNNNNMISTSQYSDVRMQSQCKNNVSHGFENLYNLKTGYNNVALGNSGGKNNSTGYNNIIIGNECLNQYDLGNNNIAIGTKALYSNTSASENIAIGNNALLNDIHGNGNSALGANTDVDGKGNWMYSTAIGYNTKIGKSNSIILGDSTNENMCVGIGINNPSTRFHVSGDTTMTGKLEITNVLSPNGGISITDTYLLDTINKTSKLEIDFEVTADTVLNNLTVNDYCKPNKGIDVNDGDCVIATGGFSTFGKTGNTSNQVSPLVTINGFVRVNNDMQVTGQINADKVMTNSLIFIDYFEPNGGIAMYKADDDQHPIFQVYPTTGNIVAQGFLTVYSLTHLYGGLSVSTESNFNGNVTIKDGACLKHLTTGSNFLTDEVKITDGKTCAYFKDFGDGNVLKFTGEGNVLFESGLSKITIQGSLEVEKDLKVGSLSGPGTIPIGGIIMWSGSEKDLTDDWAICNGENGTPDLKGRFIMGSTYNEEINFDTNRSESSGLGGDSQKYETGDKGGNSLWYVEKEEIPPLISTDFTVNDPEHNHKLSVGNHTHTLDYSKIATDPYVNSYGYESGPGGPSGGIKDSNGNFANMIPLTISNNTKIDWSGNTRGTGIEPLTIQTVQTTSSATGTSAFALTVPTYKGDTRLGGRVDEAILQLDQASASQQSTISTSIDNPSLGDESTAKATTGVTVEKPNKSQDPVNIKPSYYVLAFIMRIK